MKLEKQLPVRMLAKIFLDTFAFASAIIVSYILRFSLSEAFGFIKEIYLFVPVLIGVRLVSFALFRLYSSLWRYSSLTDLMNIIKATTIGTLVIVMFNFAFHGIGLSRFIIAMEWLLVIFFTGGIRIFVRHYHLRPEKGSPKEQNSHRVLIYGAGRAGELLLRNINNSGMKNNGFGIEVIGFVDDDPAKQGKYIHDKQVLGQGNQIRELVYKHLITDVYFAISALSGKNARQILKMIRGQIDDNIEIKTIPGLHDFVQGRVSVNQLRKFEIKDLLRRNPVHLDVQPVEEMIYNRRVMVVGGGGSIGQELCNQIAMFNPRQLILFDSCEFNVYESEAYLQNKFPKLNLVCLVADASKEQLVRKAFEDYQPSLVFHAAAYKHVPLMEANPWAAVINNLQSTLVLSRISSEFGVDRFILISTDKAVQPSSIMGVSKRICELIALLHGTQNKTKFMAVRFGNVLGSSGSVIPKFKKQIANGEPITVTHPDITRYFMLISEAVELVLQAGAIGKNGNIYVLDMGEPIKIVDLAKYMIELSGLKVNDDIPIIYTGLRPGEKLHETLFREGEESNTHIPNLFVLEPKLTVGMDYLNQVKHLIDTCHDYNLGGLQQALKHLIPEYTPDPSLTHFTTMRLSDNLHKGTNGGTNGDSSKIFKKVKPAS